MHSFTGDNDRLTRFLDAILHKSGEIALKSFGKISSYSLKDDLNQVVSEVDLASEKLLITAISEMYPQDSILAEESGYVKKQGQFTWILDPIDGSSNYVNALPWFGVMVARVDNTFHPVTAGIYLPVTGEIVIAQKGHGAFYNGKRVVINPENDLSKCLISICADSSQDPAYINHVTAFYKNVLQNARNVRTTNSAVDYFYAGIGKIGGMVNFTNKVWDVAPILLIAQEAGMKVTDVNGQAIDLRVEAITLSKNFTIVIANSGIQGKLLEALKQSNNPTF